MRTAAGKKGIHLLLAFLLAIGLWPPAPAAAAEPQETRTNLLAADMDTGFDGGTSPFTLEIPTSGGSQQIVQIGGNNALEFRDASLGANANSYFFYELTSGALLSRINDIYRMPVGTTPTEFVFEYKLLRSAASTKPVPGNTYAQLQMAPYDNVSVPRFPAGYPSITGTAAYTNTTPDELKTVNDEDLPSYRFSIVPNGGQKLITSFKIAFSIRVDTGATDEAYVIDDLAIYEAGGGVPGDDEAPSAPSGLIVADITDTSVKLAWTAATDNTGVTKYDIYRNGALLESVSGSTLTHKVAGLSPNTTYRFTVNAGDGG
ncbi:fibronectin type III domain-containing protein, partial [Paenibacillus agaridevorans]|uniref:fibronectin type III domain-containing protein n=1 Tax=Paenibacillus agaridevorans TaxID=171404 RepID=UPI0015E7E9CC